MNELALFLLPSAAPDRGGTVTGGGFAWRNMVQFTASTVPLHNAAGPCRLDDVTMAAIRRAVASYGEAEPRSAQVIEGPAGAPIYVVVVERPAEVLATCGQLQCHFSLTQREAEVALLAGRRLSVAEMADELGVTSHTVRRHVERILEKMRLTRRQDVRGVLLEVARRERERCAQVERLERARRARRLQTAAA